MATEREVKFALDEGIALPALDGDGRHVVDHGVTAISAVYYDTAGMELARRHLGVRRRIGDAWTFKGPSQVEDGALVREEIEWPDADAPPAELRSRLERELGAVAELVAVVRLRTERHRYEVRDEAGRRLAEIDDDVVSVYDGEQVVDRFREVEIELAGDAVTAAVEALVHRIESCGAVRHTTGKLTRALRVTGKLP